MNLTALVLALTTLQTGLVFAQPAADEKAIRALVDHWQQAWERFDGSVLENDYAEDADWLNAFGVRQKGGTKIVAYVSRVMGQPQLKGRHTIWDEPRIRIIRPDVAIAYRDYRTVGHKLPDGTELPERRTHSTWMLTKENGRWRIASQVISDELSQGAH